MNKREAYQEMLSGQMITNKYFTFDEYLVYNSKKDRIETEEGYHMDNFWNNNYLPNVNWELYEDSIDTLKIVSETKSVVKAAGTFKNKQLYAYSDEYGHTVRQVWE